MKVQLSSTVLILTILTFVSGAPPERKPLSLSNPLSVRGLDTTKTICKYIPNQCEIKNGKPVLKKADKSNKHGHFSAANHKASKIAAQDDSTQNSQGQDDWSSNNYSDDGNYSPSQTYNYNYPTASIDSNGDGSGNGQNDSPYPTTMANDDNSYPYTSDYGSYSTQGGEGNDPDASQPTNTVSSSVAQASSTFAASLPSLEQPDATQSSDTNGADGDSNHTYSITLSTDMIHTGLCKPSRFVELLWEKACPIGSTAGSCGAKVEYDCDYYSPSTKDVDIKWNSTSQTKYDTNVRPCTLQIEAEFDSNTPLSNGTVDTSLADFVKNSSTFLWQALEQMPGGTTLGQIDSEWTTSPAALNTYLVPQQMLIVGKRGAESADDANAFLHAIMKFSCPAVQRKTDCGFIGFLGSLLPALIPGLGTIASMAASLTIGAVGGAVCN